jgi:hypothetical protein
VLIDPGVVARFRAILLDAFEARTGIGMEAPTLGAVIAGGFRPVQRPLALAAVEAAQVTAPE